MVFSKDDKPTHGHKLHPSYDNLVDLQLLKVCEVIGKPLHNLGVTPNMITLFGLCLAFVTFYFFIKKQYIVSLIFLWLTYFSDCLDGYMARSFQQITTLGDYLDHFRDHFFFLTLICLIFVHIESTIHKCYFIVVIAIYAILMMIHFGCQEEVTEYKEANDCLRIFQRFCFGKVPKNTIQYTKWFGAGTFICVLSLFIVLLQLSCI